ncbi:hypothetical protein MNBD_GAMMA12-654 [hydrothermal vent metagenome]|uniref:peptidylprolyl isomerase n=1 Tax=hydrothermal vent metagenome TaxID=652676 RepID=A0A3B0Y565_9ZZZZ
MSKFGFSTAFTIVVLFTACNQSFADKNQENKSKVATTKPQPSSSTKYTDEQKLSYSMGVEIGVGLQRSSKQTNMHKDLKIDMLAQGLKDSFSGKKLMLTKTQMRQVITLYRNKLIMQRQVLLAKYKQEHSNYFKKIKKSKGMTIHKSGIVYKIIKPGKGALPKPNDKVQVHYSVLTAKGKVLFSSKKAGKAVTMIPSRSFLGVFKVVIPLMKPGSKWSVHTPAKLAFGIKGRPPQVKPMQAFVFNIELLAISPKSDIKTGTKDSSQKGNTQKGTHKPAVKTDQKTK